MIPTAAGEEKEDRPDTTESSTVDPVDMVNLRYYSLTRLGWALTLEHQSQDSPFTSQVRVCVDLYTGEILNWDMAK